MEQGPVGILSWDKGTSGCHFIFLPAKASSCHFSHCGYQFYPPLAGTTFVLSALGKQAGTIFIFLDEFHLCTHPLPCCIRLVSPRQELLHMPGALFFTPGVTVFAVQSRGHPLNNGELLKINWAAWTSTKDTQPGFRAKFNNKVHLLHKASPSRLGEWLFYLTNVHKHRESSKIRKQRNTL